MHQMCLSRSGLKINEPSGTTSTVWSKKRPGPRPGRKRMDDDEDAADVARSKMGQILKLQQLCQFCRTLRK